MTTNDPITVVQDGLLVHFRYAGTRFFSDGVAAPDEMIVKRQSLGVKVTILKIDDEGLTWCRGHVSDKDEAGAALLAAAALEEPKKLQPPPAPQPMRQPQLAALDDDSHYPNVFDDQEDM